MKPSIKILDIFYGSRCQLACDQCDTRSDDFRKGEFDPNILSIKEGILLASKKFDIEIFSLLGGEPLLYKDKIVSILDYIRSIDNDTLIFLPTNGELISKNIEFLSSILPKYKVLLMVSDHFKLFENNKKSLSILDSCIQLAKSMNISKVNSDLFWTEIMYKRPNDNDWKNYWEEIENYKEVNYSAKENKLKQPTDNILFWNGNYGIFLHEQPIHVKHYYMKDNNPKPFLSEDINKSYFNNCPSCYCTFMYDKKLYKCAALGTLKQFLTKHDSINDIEWGKFIRYRPLDLTSCSYDDTLKFSISKFKPIEECSMCPSSIHEVLLTEKNVLPIKFQRK
jgi:organic radical activating enzyme